MSQVEVKRSADRDRASASNLYRMFLKGKLVDTTIVCATHCVRAHKLMLSANSEYLRKILIANHPSESVILLADLDVDILKALIEFMYIGITRIPESKFDEMQMAANYLEIYGFETAVMKKYDEEHPVEIPVLEGPKDPILFECDPELPLGLGAISHQINSLYDKIFEEMSPEQLEYYVKKGEVIEIAPNKTQ